MADSLYYVYAVVPPQTAVAVAPAGVDGARVELIANDGVAALVSRVDGAAYGANVDDLVADVAWLGPRATAHDTVLTWASDVGAVIPLPLLSLFRSSDAVRDMLVARRDQLARLLDHVARGREYGVRVFRLDDELRAVLGEHSSAIAALEGEVAGAASPGQGYLLARKLDAARKEELRRVATMIANTAYVDLAAISLEATQDALPKSTAEQSGAAVLNASFLVAHERVDEFRAAVTAFVRNHDRRGFRVEFTGPWPPYHFTRGVADVR
jgi:hypothetical protein